MNSRQPEATVFSIEAIMQKNQHPIKNLTSMPTDIKQLFVNQLIQSSNKKSEIKPSMLYFQGKGDRLKSKVSQERIPPLPPRPKQSKSLNTSKDHRKSDSMKTTRTSKPRIKNPIELVGSRHSLSEAIPACRRTIEPENSEKIIEQKDDCRSPRQKVLESMKSISENNLNRQHSIDLQKKMNSFQIQFHAPTNSSPHRKKTVRRHQRLDQLDEIVRINEKGEANQQQSYEKKQQRVKKGNSSTHTSFYKKKLKTSLEAIPDYVMAAIATEANIKGQSGQVQSPGKKPKEVIITSQFNFENCEKKGMKEGKLREVKQPNCVIQMKKKIEFHKTRRSEQSVEEPLEPQVQYLQLTKKQFPPRKSKILKKDPDRKKRSVTHQKPRRKRLIEDEEVCGWDVAEGPMFLDYY